MAKVNNADFVGFVKDVQNLPKYQIMNMFYNWHADPNVWLKDLKFDPSWCIERCEDGNVHIHFLDFKMNAMKDLFEAYCKKESLVFSEDERDKYSIPESVYGISLNGKRIVSVHDTLCSTPQKSYICVHATMDREAIDILLSLPFWQSEYPIIKQRDLELYRKLYEI